MNRIQAVALVKQTFTRPFDKARYRNFVLNVLNRLDESKAQQWNSTYVKDAFKAHVQRFERLGTYTSPDKETLDVLAVYLTSESKLERARTAIRNFVADHLKNRDEKDAALVAFVSPSEATWRFSYVKMEYAAVEQESGRVGVESRLTPARRFSYIVGEGESCHTAQSRFLPLLEDSDKNPELTAIEDAFSVEAVTKEFFNKYAELFGEINAALEKIVSKDPQVRHEFTAKNISTVDFAKKLMGQIVFLYFLQKKGWLGVAKDAPWGTGHHNFLRHLANGQYGNFFNDVLEPLFYDTLATDRGHEAWCARFKCRIPFLNGGLFEPLGDYDWKKVDVPLPNKLFTNSEFVDEGITGTGVLDVFDRYNFTVNESEPLEKEVAIDPEMLGKVFENLIEENRRKGLGAYYTPREIVHYMCRESLVSYLFTCADQSKIGIARQDIETFVELGEQISHYEAVETKYSIKMPKSIQQHSRWLDEMLAKIAVCDPAVGSGAFPVGMMMEIVRCRTALTPYFNDCHERTPYHFKRHAIQSCLYGVDIDAGAVDIAKLRLWLSLVVDEEETKHIKPLPNLDFKIVAGNSLLGFPYKSRGLEEIEKLKSIFFESTDHSEKAKLKKQIERRLAECFAASKKSFGYEISFDFQVYFSEVFHAKGGFDVVIANPPYIFARDSAKKGFKAEDKQYFYKYYELAEYQLNLYPLFVEKGTHLLRPGGALCFITPNNWLTINTNKAMRKFVLGQSDVTVVNFYARVFESADVDSAIVVFKRSDDNHRIRLFEYTNSFQFVKEADCEFFLRQREHVINIEAFKSGGAAELMQKIESHSIPLSEVSDIKAGLKAYETGCGSPPQTEVMKKNRVYHSTKKLDKTYLKYLDGKDVCRYQLGWSGEYLKYGDNLAAPRKDFRLFSTKRILVRQIPAKPPLCVHACLTDEVLLNDLNSMNIINIRENPGYVLGVLNSRLVSWWFVHKFGKMQRETFPQFKVNELADFPLPSNGDGYRNEIAALVEKILAAKKSDGGRDTTAWDSQIDRMVYEAFGLTQQEIKIVESGNTGSALSAKAGS